MATLLPGKPLTALARCTRPTSNVNASMGLRFTSTLQAHAQVSAGMRRNLFDDIVETNSDLSRTRAGKTERGGSEVMSFLSKPNRIWLFDVDRNPVLHGILKTTFYNQFNESAGMRRTLFDDIVETNSDLSRTRAGKTERGGGYSMWIGIQSYMEY
jgi:hypothetical protein